jgi:polysaccharide export outer membrane protein
MTSTNGTSVSGTSKYPIVCSRFGLILVVVVTLLASSGCYRPIIKPGRLPSDLVAPPIVNPQTIDLSRLSGFLASNDLIEPGDVIEVTVVAGIADQGPLTVPVRIGDDGVAMLPLMGEIPLAGLELQQAEQIIRETSISRGVFRNPHVTVVMKKKRINKVTVIGAVKKPGIYELPRGASNLLSAFVAAGGLNSDAGTDVEIRSPAKRAFSPNDGTENRLAGYFNDSTSQKRSSSQSVRINLISASQAGRGINLRDGDVVMVPKRDQNPVQVLGLVRKPGEYKLPTDRELHVLDVLAMSGGMTSAVADKIYVIRRIPNQTDTQVIKISYRKAKRKHSENIRLASGDVVSVERTPMTVMFAAFDRFVNFGIGATARIPMF